jgi:hypothetical protein
MHEQENNLQDTEKMWNVMVHLSPQFIDTMLHKELRGELEPVDPLHPTSNREPFEFFVPYLFMRPDASDELREIFHSFVFISASPERLRSILTSEWNTKSRLHLRYYRDHSGRDITISNEECRQLRATILNRQLKVFFGKPVEPVGEMAVGDRVTLLIDDWNGKQGKIERIRLKKGRVAMTVAVNILGRTKSVNFENLHDGDVIFADHDTEQLLTGNLISNIEGKIATMLGHYFHKDNAVQMRRDYPWLTRFLSYASIQVDDDEERLRFTSLMLLCATMLGESALCEQYTRQLSEWLGDITEPRTDTDAYVMLALFVSTRDPQLRDAVKAYRKTHPSCSPIIGTFINKVRDANTRKS